MRNLIGLSGGSMLLVSMALGAGQTRRFEITGTVKDYSTDQGIVGVQIDVVEGSLKNEKHLGTGISLGDGSYKIDGFSSSGKLKVRFTKAIYKPRPKTVVRNLSGNAAIDVRLHRESSENPQYYIGEAKVVKAEAAKHPGPRADAFEAQAEYLKREVGLSMVHFVKIARALRDIATGDIPRKDMKGFEGYFEVEVQAIEEAQRAFTLALSTGEPIPKMEALRANGIRMDVSLDIAAYCIRERGLTDQDKATVEFVDNFGKSWGPRSAESLQGILRVTNDQDR